MFAKMIVEENFLHCKKMAIKFKNLMDEWVKVRDILDRDWEEGNIVVEFVDSTILGNISFEKQEDRTRYYLMLLYHQKVNRTYSIYFSITPTDNSAIISIVSCTIEFDGMKQMDFLPFTTYNYDGVEFIDHISKKMNGVLEGIFPTSTYQIQYPISENIVIETLNGSSEYYTLYFWNALWKIAGNGTYKAKTQAGKIFGAVCSMDCFTQEIKNKLYRNADINVTSRLSFSSRGYQIVELINRTSLIIPIYLTAIKDFRV